jgi:hypothetical protein
MLLANAERIVDLRDSGEVAGFVDVEGETEDS